MVVAVHENEGVAPRHHLVAHRLEDRLAAQLLRIVAVLHVFLGDRDLCLADEVVEVLLVEILAGKAHPAEAQLIDIRVELLADLGVCAVLHDAAVGPETDLLSHGSPPLPLSPSRPPPPLLPTPTPREPSGLPAEPAA